jgi:formylglycine-generating enzyme required for sulfatase activity
MSNGPKKRKRAIEHGGIIGTFNSIASPATFALERTPQVGQEATLTFKGFHDEYNKKAQFPLFQCEDNSVEFVLIPGGSFTMGLSDALEEQLYNLIVETYELEELPDDEVLERTTAQYFKDRF